MNKKTATSISLSKDVQKALDIIIKNYDGVLPVKSRSQIIEFLIKKLVYQIMNDEPTPLGDIENVKKHLAKNGYTSDTYFNRK